MLFRSGRGMHLPPDMVATLEWLPRFGNPDVASSVYSAAQAAELQKFLSTYPVGVGGGGASVGWGTWVGPCVCHSSWGVTRPKTTAVVAATLWPSAGGASSPRATPRHMQASCYDTKVTCWSMALLRGTLGGGWPALCLRCVCLPLLCHCTAGKCVSDRVSCQCLFVYMPALLPALFGCHPAGTTTFSWSTTFKNAIIVLVARGRGWRAGVGAVGGGGCTGVLVGAVGKRTRRRCPRDT